MSRISFKEVKFTYEGVPFVAYFGESRMINNLWDDFYVYKHTVQVCSGYSDEDTFLDAEFTVSARDGKADNVYVKRFHYRGTDVKDYKKFYMSVDFDDRYDLSTRREAVDWLLAYLF